MDDFLRYSPMPWPFKAVIALSIPLILSILLLHMPDKWLLKCRDPNRITLGLIPFFFLGMYLHLTCLFYWGAVLVALVTVGDVMDGKLDKLMIRLGIPRSALSRRWGALLDPLADKLRQLPVIWFYMAFFAYLSPWLAWSIIAVDVMGTFVREPFIKVKSEASVVGKIKTLLQALGMMTFVPYELNWYQDRWPTYVMLIPALVMGVLSVALRFFKQPQWVKNLMARSGRLFQHEPIKLRTLWQRSVSYLSRRDA